MTSPGKILVTGGAKRIGAALSTAGGVRLESGSAL